MISLIWDTVYTGLQRTLLGLFYDPHQCLLHVQLQQRVTEEHAESEVGPS